jgi:hypothetical protein
MTEETERQVKEETHDFKDEEISNEPVYVICSIPGVLLYVIARNNYESRSRRSAIAAVPVYTYIEHSLLRE